MARSWRHMFVVFRVDGDAVELRPSEDPNSFITIKEIVDTEAEAVAEVKRLDALNSGKGARYFFQSAKYFTSGRPSSEG
jgi:excinuclease UvrABC helicase subunit UvrB